MSINNLTKIYHDKLLAYDILYDIISSLEVTDHG